MRRVAFLPLVAGLLLAPTPAAADVRDDYERSLGTAVRQLTPPGLLGHPWRGTGTTVAGDAVVSRGELVLEDRPFDDTGADTRPGNGPTVQTAVDGATLNGLCGPGSSFSTGDVSYPAGEAYGPRNAADLVQVRLAVRRDRVHVLWQLQTVVDPGTVAVGVLFDTDDDPATGRDIGYVGFERSLVVSTDHAAGMGLGARWAFDAEANTFEGSFPRTELPEGPWRVQALAGLRAGSELAPVTDLAHVPDEPVLQAPACKLDARQSALIASGVLPGARVHPARLARGDSDRPALRRGLFTRYYVPDRPLGEGIVGQPRYGQTSSASVYRGTVQPYTAYVPSTYDPRRPAPVLLLLHCLTCWHTVYAQASFPGLARLAESRGAIVVTPFGQGEGGHYEGEAEVDAFAVLSDVSRRYAVDQERLYLSGMSMGALGTYRLGLLHPDLWARLLTVASYTTPFCVTPVPQTLDCGAAFNYLSVFPNARNLPVGILTGTLDELTPVTGNRHYADVLTGLGYRFRYWEYPTRTHDPELHGLTTDVTEPFLADVRRERSPATVTYVVDREMHREGALPDQAYWVNGLRLSDGERFGRVDATSGQGNAFTVQPVSGEGTSEAGPWTMRGLAGRPTPSSGRNQLDVVLRGFAAAAVDLPAARLTRDRPLTVRAEVDRPVQLRVGQEVLSLPTGRTTFVLPPREAAGQPATRAAATSALQRLPATGGLEAVSGLLLLAAGLLIRRRTA